MSLVNQISLSFKLTHELTFTLANHARLYTRYVGTAVWLQTVYGYRQMVLVLTSGICKLRIV